MNKHFHSIRLKICTLITLSHDDFVNTCSEYMLNTKQTNKYQMCYFCHPLCFNNHKVKEVMRTSINIIAHAD